jgi:hypothetical protein
MKFLINSKVLVEHIKLAVQFKAFRIQVRGDSIIFSALREIEMPVAFVVHHDTFDIKFSTFRWQKIRNFVMDLPDQPLTVELWDDRISISCDALFAV